MNITIDTTELKPLLEQLKPSQIATVQTMALNRAVKKGRTEIKRAIQAVYTFSSSQIDSKDPDKGLSVRTATKNNLEAVVVAGHSPRNLATAKIKLKSVTTGYKFQVASRLKTKKQHTFRQAIRTQYVEAEITKGVKTIFHSAFILGVTKGKKGAKALGDTQAIFARGKYNKGIGFAFAGKSNNASKPIGSLKTLSMATAAQNVGVENTYAPIVEGFATNEFERLIKAKINV